MPLRAYPVTLTPTVTRRPEVLAPVGDETSLAAALGSGANAVYFGLDDGFNARARATNMSLARLPEICARVHRAGARAYVTLNTLVFESELAKVADILVQLGESGVDAIIVQDPAVCLLAQRLAPGVEIHASTQMTISSAEGAAFSATLGVSRVVLPRELSLAEIADVVSKTELETEIFIHGALCMSWSGQCLTSEAWGGRSANRGQCAQSCRMPYDLIVDGEHKPLGDIRYLLSPRDLAGYRAVPALMEIGVHTLKVEGRLKGPAYVHTAVTGLHQWMDDIEDGNADTPEAKSRLAKNLSRMSVAFSRGFSDGFFAGADHQTLVEGRFPKHRGLLVGFVTEVDGNNVDVRRAKRAVADGQGELANPLVDLGGASHTSAGLPLADPDIIRGVGVSFDSGKPEQAETGGPVFDVEPTDEGWRLSFGRPGPDMARIEVGQRVWLNGDSRLGRAAAAVSREPEGRHLVSLVVSGGAGQPLQVTASLASGYSVTRSSESSLEVSSSQGIDDALLRSKLAGFGGTALRLGDETAALNTSDLPTGLHLPVRELKIIRRAIAEDLIAHIERGPALPRPAVKPAAVLAELRSATASHVPNSYETKPTLIPLVREPAQLEAVIDAGFEHVELDWMELVGLGKAFKRAKDAGLRVTLATVRVQKPGENGFDRRLQKLSPDGVLVRHWGGLMHFAEAAHRDGLLVHGDFSLNVTNSLTANHLFRHGLDTLTVSHDLDVIQLRELVRACPAERLSVTVHHHISTFHTEHCVYSANLSDGRDYRSCGRPCDRHKVALRDHRGEEHPVVVDVGCRNTIFNAQAQSAAFLMPELVEAGVRRFRAEFVWETYEETQRVLAAYRGVLEGSVEPSTVPNLVGVHEQFGVTKGTFAV